MDCLWSCGGNCELKFPSRSVNRHRPLTRPIRSGQLHTWSEYAPSKVFFIQQSPLSLFWHSSQYQRGAHKMNYPANATLKIINRNTLSMRELLCEELALSFSFFFFGIVVWEQAGKDHSNPCYHSRVMQWTQKHSANSKVIPLSMNFEL